MSKLRLLDRATGKRKWVGKAKPEWSLTYIDFDNRSNHTVTANGLTYHPSFIHNSSGPKQAVHFFIDDGPQMGWYFLYDAGFNVYTTRYDFELLTVD